MAFSTARTQFQPPLPELASAILLATLLHRFGHTESVTFSPESPPLLLVFPNPRQENTEASEAVLT
jgi:hypothetical protein